MLYIISKVASSDEISESFWGYKSMLLIHIIPYETKKEV